MLSNYFNLKVCTEFFKEHIESLIAELKDSKVLVYGIGEAFYALNQEYEFTEKLNIVAFADKKYETCEKGQIFNIKTISPREIEDEDYEYILVVNEYYNPIVKFLEAELYIPSDKIKLIFKEEIKDERTNIGYLYKQNFNKTLPELIKKLKNKRVVIYGAGAYLQLIQKYFDLSGLNIVAITDRRFQVNKNVDEFLGYKTIMPHEIEDVKPDCVLVATKFYVSIIEDLYFDLLHKKNIKIKPLVKKPFLTLIKEIWNM